MRRIYHSIIDQHFLTNRQMVFFAGPRQVGKTTTSTEIGKSRSDFLYLNWDNADHRKLLLSGPTKVSEAAHLPQLTKRRPLLIFDEIHKYKKWKLFLKGFFDTYQKLVDILVTGSAKLDVFKRGGDSMMGRYFLYRYHPLSIREISDPSLSSELIRAPKQLNSTQFQNLWKFGGFPEPFIKASERFHYQWQSLRKNQLFNEDLRELTQIHEMKQMEVFANLLSLQASNQLSFSNLAEAVQISPDTSRRWIAALESLYYCFLVRPWAKKVSRSLKKEPKVYLWDWSTIKDPGARTENFVASHLLKAVHFWTDHGLGVFNLYYLKDKSKREVDFLITREEEPWFLVEVKKSMNHALSPELYYFQKQIQAKHAFQVVLDMDFISKDCFEYEQPTIVPLRTLLSQLV